LWHYKCRRKYWNDNSVSIRVKSQVLSDTCQSNGHWGHLFIVSVVLKINSCSTGVNRIHNAVFSVSALYKITLQREKRSGWCQSLCTTEIVEQPCNFKVAIKQQANHAKKLVRRSRDNEWSKSVSKTLTRDIRGKSL